MGACTVPGQLMIVTELMRGDLESMLIGKYFICRIPHLEDEQANLSLLTRMKLAKDAALGVLWLHSSNPQIIHRDLKVNEKKNTKKVVLQISLVKGIQSFGRR